jgi:hypothetical protein
MLDYSGTLRPNHLRQRLSSRPPHDAQFAIVCSQCSFKWYFRSDWEVLECRNQHEHRNSAVFTYRFIPTRHLPRGLTLYQHVWVELVDFGEINLKVV